MTKQLEIHPAGDLFPTISGDDFALLRDDIKTNGLRVPIVLYEDKILDGRNRYLACSALGMEPKFTTYKGQDPAAYVVSLNLHRRHLTESQRAMVAGKLATLKNGERPAQICAGEKTQEEAAELLNVSRRAVQQARKVQSDGTPELIKAVETGEVSVSAAATVADLPKREQAKAVKQGPKAVKEKAAKVRKGKKPETPPPPGREWKPVEEASGAQESEANESVEGDIGEEGLSDAEWVAKLPARAKLHPTRLKTFDADALLYRKLETVRKTFQYHASRALKSARQGEYGFRLSRFLKTDHPKHWLVCASVEHGGCGGTGTLRLVGQCPKCHGRGYWING